MERDFGAMDFQELVLWQYTISTKVWETFSGSRDGR